MSEVMKCPKCGGEMEKGRFRVYPLRAYVGFDKSGGFWLPQIKPVVAFRCQKCDFIELYGEKEDSAK
jgi:predicted nucleic-acid-binding Zn-ribbon protein